MSDYELTRRDAVAALATAGVAVGSVGGLTWDTLDPNADDPDPEFTDRHRSMLEAVASIVYPSLVSGIPEFLESYVVGRVRDDPERMEGMVESLEYLDSYAKRWHDGPFLDLATAEREAVLKAMGAHVVDPEPDGGDAHRFRFYVVNELLYALYTSPTGAELVGLENPQGFPGGTDSYQQPPDGRSE